MATKDSRLADARSARVYDLATEALVAVRCVVPGLALTSEANNRDGWYRKRGGKGRHTHQKIVTANALRHQVGKHCPLPMPLLVRIIVVRPRRLDSDNNVGAAKHVRDAIADWVGVDDGSDDYHWDYRRAIGPHAVVIELRHVEHTDGEVTVA